MRQDLRYVLHEDGKVRKEMGQSRARVIIDDEDGQEHRAVYCRECSIRIEQLCLHDRSGGRADGGRDWREGRLVEQMNLWVEMGEVIADMSGTNANGIKGRQGDCPRRTQIDRRIGSDVQKCVRSTLMVVGQIRIKA